MKIVEIVYKTSIGKEIIGKFLKTFAGYKPIFVEDGYLDIELNKIISEKELDIL